MGRLEELSVRDLKQILKMKSSEFSSEKSSEIMLLLEKILDKHELVELCSRYISIEEIEGLLLRSKTKDLEKKNVRQDNVSSTTRNQPSTSPSANSSIEMEQLANMSPEQLKYQAAMIRQNPSAFRASQPALRNMTDEQILQAAAQMEMMASNPTAFQAMKDQVKNMSPEQMERLRQSHAASGQNLRQEAADYGNLTPDQMRYRAECMRKHPEIVRASNPMMASLTDDQIRAAADQMEALAQSNPDFMKNMSEYISNMSDDEMRQFQQSMGGTIPPPTSSTSSSSPYTPSRSSTTPASLPDMLNLNEEQIEMLVKTFKSNPEMTRQMLRSQGMSDEQISKQYEFLCSMDENTLKSTLKSLLSVQRYLRPLTGYYEIINQKTGGYGKVIVGTIGAILIIIILVVLWKLMNLLWYGVIYQALGYFYNRDEMSTPSAPEAHPSNTVTNNNVVQDEFEF